MSDKLIEKLLAKASEKEQEIGRISGYDRNTNLSFPMDEGNIRSNINLNIITTVPELVAVLAHLKAKSRDFTEAAKELEVNSKFVWGGYSYKAWFEDIKNRVDVISLKKKKKELKDIKEQLNELMSPEMKREMKLKELEKQLEAGD